MSFLGRQMRAFGWGRTLGVFLLVLLCAVRIVDPTPIELMRGQAFDMFQRLKPRAYVAQPVAIVDIDEDSIRRFGQWPWPRARMADLVDKMTAMGMAAAAFDIVFAEGDRLSPGAIAADNSALPDDIRAALQKLPDNDELFASSIARSRIVMGQTSVRSARTSIGAERNLRDVPHAFLGVDARPFLPNYPELVRNLDPLENAASGRGMFTVVPDADGVFRRVPMVMLVEDRLRLSLSAELLRIATGGKAVAIRSNEAGLEGLVLARQLVKTDRTGRVWPYFTPSLPQRFVSAGNILDGTANPQRLRGHLVLVGTSAVGLEDYRATPMASLMAGVEIHAQVLENVLAGTMLERPATAVAVELLVALVLGLLAIAFVPMLGARLSFVFAATLIFCWLAVSWFSFDWYRWLIDPVFPALATGLMFMWLGTWNYFREEQRRSQIRGAFGQYVSPDLVDELAANPGVLTLGGETRELTLLFSDVRDFTSISESYRHDPEGLTVLMNRFLTVLSNAVMRNKGTIDKFMGDAVMAFWNAPLKIDDHPKFACQAAIAMIEEVQALNEEGKTAFDALNETEKEEFGTFHEINVGIGINTGDCVVGNMGSDTRFDYTALGDTVNLASRLEGQSKPYGIKIVVGSNTHDHVKEDFAFLEIDLIRVKGKSQPETIYGLFGDKALRENPDFVALRQTADFMLNSYRNQDWATALEFLDDMREIDESLGLRLFDLLLVYETRILEFQSNPPGSNWQGIYDALSK